MSVQAKNHPRWLLCCSGKAFQIRKVNLDQEEAAFLHQIRSPRITRNHSPEFPHLYTILSTLCNLSLFPAFLISTLPILAATAFTLQFHRL
ncbi:hypothetical protein TIFTF001_016422 [Ficus carica]|uniref:Uncharacterized protein n=1 Tax=Ficus carica TaxID=3494 RepID=A0AA88DIU4_FICCA|nr:hypothetical protein TIFTF001_016422 [Ficus carica]